MVLQENTKMKNQDLAQWFGLSYERFRRKDVKEKKLKELEDYCTFDVCRGGVVIKEVYFEVYDKNKAIDNYDAKVVEQVMMTGLKANEVNGDRGYLVSGRGLAREFGGVNDEMMVLKQSTVENKYKESLNRSFGKCGRMPSAMESEGKRGRRKKVWVVQVDREGCNYRFLTKEEDELFSELIRDYLDVKGQMLITKQWRDKEITDQEYLDYGRGLWNYYNRVLVKFKERTGLTLTYASQCMRGEEES